MNHKNGIKSKEIRSFSISNVSEFNFKLSDESSSLETLGPIEEKMNQFQNMKDKSFPVWFLYIIIMFLYYYKFIYYNNIKTHNNYNIIQKMNQFQNMKDKSFPQQYVFIYVCLFIALIFF
jgi:hypothetical protein